jgi:hypothetical protein
MLFFPLGFRRFVKENGLSATNPTGKMKKFELSFVQEALDRLVAEGFTGILVGGHAVNFWAYIYRQMTPEWSELLPFTSEDVDFLGGRAEALLCKRLFGGVSNLNDGTDPSPQAGVILAPLNGTTVRFDIITSIIGVDSREVGKKALSRPGDAPGKSLRVLHPLHCLFGKTAGLAQIPQAGRQDLKHLKLSILIVHAYFMERLSEVHPLLNNIESIFELALGELGLRVWHRHGVEVEKALPLIAIATQLEERLQKFAEVRLPQLIGQLAETRQRYFDSLSES